MSLQRVMPTAMDGNQTIDLIIKAVNRLYKDVQLQDAYQNTDEGVMEEDTPEHQILTSRSTGGETLKKITSEMSMILPTTDASGGTGLKRTKTAPPRNLTDPVNMIRKLQGALRRLKRNVRYMRSLQLDVEAELNKQFDLLSLVGEDAETSGILHTGLTNWIENDLENVTKKLLDLLSKVPVPPEKRNRKEASQNYQDGDGVGHGRRAYLPGIHANKDLKRLAIFRDVKSKLEKLSITSQICLLSFSVFPENQKVNGTMLMYWWIGEGILPCGDEAEVALKYVLKDLVENNLIESVRDKRKVEPCSYKTTPFVHSSLVLLSKEIGLFDIYHEREKPSMRKSELLKVCLVEGSSSQPEAKAKNMPDANYIETVFNVSERFPDFTCKWFSKTRSLKVLYLGRWERSERDIEVDSLRVMKILSCMSNLRFLSLQGISTIRSLSRAACKLSQLIILDLRGCYNLEQLPEGIHKLQRLVYLDLTGCEALESIPIGLASLLNLEVLKGFVVSDDREIACKLIELKRLPKLRKLSVIIYREAFGCDELITVIREFVALEKLKAQWGSGSSASMKRRDIKARKKIKKPEDFTNKFSASVTFSHSKYPRGYRLNHDDNLPKQLKKLDLQRFPDSKLPNCLWPENLLYLETLHLGSSRRLKKLSHSPLGRASSSVKVLRLTCLPKLRVEWRELTQVYFPKLRFLESYECPRVTFCPCDRDGIWRSDEC